MIDIFLVFVDRNFFIQQEHERNFCSLVTGYYIGCEDGKLDTGGSLFQMFPQKSRTPDF